MNQSEYLALPHRPNAGLMVVNPRGRVFAGRRIDFKSDAWQMPQGGIDKGETPRDAALRELVEETGIRPDMVTVSAESRHWHAYDFPYELGRKLWKGRYRGQKQRWFRLDFLGDDDQINIATDHPEFETWCWMDAGELLDKVIPFKRDIYRKVFAELLG